ALEAPPFLTPRPATPLALALVPRPDHVALGVDRLLPAELLRAALLHGLGHVLLGHVRAGDERGHWDTTETISAPSRRWDRAVLEEFPEWFAAQQEQTAA